MTTKSKNAADAGFGSLGLTADKVTTICVLNTDTFRAEFSQRVFWPASVFENVFAPNLLLSSFTSLSFHSFDTLLIVIQRFVPVISFDGSAHFPHVLHLLGLRLGKSDVLHC